MEVSLFPNRIIALWLTAASIVFGCSFYFMTRDNTVTRHPDIVGPSTNSRSAIGHAAVLHMLQRLGIPALASDDDTSKMAMEGNVLVLAEPAQDDDSLKLVAKRLHSPVVLIALPKRRGTPDPDHPDRLGEDELIPIADVVRVLKLVDGSATLDRYDAIKPWNADALFAGQPFIHSTQLVHSTRLKPLLAAPEGILVGETTDNDHRIVVLSDPDLLSNHGLTRGQNAAIVAKLIQNLRPEDKKAIFDETIHGFSSRPGHSARILFEFPFVLVTMQIAIAAALVIWASSGRFGGIRMPAVPLGTGKASLIEVGANILILGGHLRLVTDRYFEAILHEAAQRHHAPPRLDVESLLGWMARIGHPLRTPPTFPENDSHAAVRWAREVYRWRRQVLYDPRRR